MVLRTHDRRNCFCSAIVASACVLLLFIGKELLLGLSCGGRKLFFYRLYEL